MADTDFSVGRFCKEIGMSRPQVHRKLSALTEQSTSRFIRTIRLNYASSYFATGVGNVFEVSNLVGFSNLSYFAKCFHKQFGLSPSEFLSKRVKRATS